MSTGLARVASAGKSAPRRSAVSVEIDGNSSPDRSHASAQRMPSPPAFVRMPTRLPAGSGWSVSRAARSRTSSRVSTRRTPAAWKSASTAASDPAMAAVWEPAARAPERLVPLLIASTGFARATRWAILPNLRGLPNDST